jgi:hypothetical protein
MRKACGFVVEKAVEYRFREHILCTNTRAERGRDWAKPVLSHSFGRAKTKGFPLFKTALSPLFISHFSQLSTMPITTTINKTNY